MPDIQETTTESDLFEFRSVLSLDFVFDFWLEEERSNANGLRELAKEINAQLAQLPELRGPLSDLSILERHRELLNLVFYAVVPPGLKGLACTALSAAGRWEFFQTTPRFQRELLDSDGRLRGEILTDGMTWETLRRLYSYLAVLRHCYGISFPFEKSVLLRTENAETGLLATYQLRAQFDMVRIRPVGELPPLDEQLLQEIRERTSSFELWQKLLPGHLFEYYGLVVYEAFEVTEEVTRSQLTELLVQPDPLVDLERFNRIEKLLRTYLKLPNLELAVIGIEGDAGFCMDGLEGLRQNLDPRDLDSLICGNDRNNLSCGQTVIHSDLANAQRTSSFMECVYREGARSFLLMPMMGDEGLAGAICLTTDEPGQLTMLTQIALKGVAPVFALALRRTLADVRTKVQAVLKEKFTSIHPTVEWRFRAAALSFVRGKGDVGDIVFPEVFSLYSASDIRSSSEMRNRAIQADLVKQIASAKSVLIQAKERSQIDYLSALIFRLDALVAELELGVRSGDELRVARLLETEVEPVFGSLEVFGQDVHESVEGYRAVSKDEDHGMIHTERRAYEHAVDRIATVQTEILTAAQERAQSVFPHLFQMYRTDGIEHSIYIGDSLTERTDFSPLYHKELKLWQLRVVAEMARASALLEKELTVPLQVAHLILAQADPIALRFSQEEKKFNVDGAYNTRYEIIKKRIDKAHVKDSQERVTQPSKIAIFFTQISEEQEYRHFIDYLQQLGVLAPGIERIDVEDLQGVHGLKALRVAVNLES